MTESFYDLAASRAFASELLAQMTLAEKAAQIAQIEKNSITPADVTEYSIGSVLSGGGGNPTTNDAVNWAGMVGSYVEASHHSRLGIPLLYGTDAVHGHSNLVGATIFPHNIGLGAANDPDLVERVYRASAVETTAVGARWMFAPALSVALDARWGRNYESFGDDPERVSELGVAAVRGMIGQGPNDPSSALTSIKHFVGDGGTAWGSANPVEWLDFWDGWGAGWQLDQGDTRIDEDELRAVHLHPFHASIAAGALTVMASYNSWNGDKLHGHRYLLTDVLKEEMGFEGFVVSDWLGQGQLDPDPALCIALTLEAGVDMIMVPFDYKEFISNVESVIESGDLTLDRLDDAVRRILTVKHALGLFAEVIDDPPSLDVIGASAHREIAREAVAASAVLLKHENDVLPLNTSEVLLAGSGSHDIGNQCGGWTIEWQGGSGPITPGTTILDAFDLQSPRIDLAHSISGAMPESMRWPVGVVVVAEPPYAEGNGDSEHCPLPHEDLQAVHEVRAPRRAACAHRVVGKAGRSRCDSRPVRCDRRCVAAWYGRGRGGRRINRHTTVSRTTPTTLARHVGTRPRADDRLHPMNLEQLANDFWRDGFLVLDDFFDVELMSRVDAKILEHFAGEPEFLHEPEFLERSDTDVIPWFPQRPDEAGYSPERAVPFDELALDVRVKDLTEALLGPGWRPLYSMVMFSMQGTNGQAWHQDCPPEDRSRHNLNRLVYTRNLSQETGGQTVVIPGSHRRGEIPAGDPNEELPGEVLLSPRSGSLVFIHGHTWHRVLPVTGPFRFSTNYRVCPEGTPDDVTDVCVYRNMRYRFSTSELLEERV